MSRILGLLAPSGEISVEISEFVSPARSAVVFCHGLGSWSGNTFALTAEKEIEKRKLADACVRFSFHSHHDGVTDLRSFSFENAKKDLATVIDGIRDLGISKISLIASSFGAQVALTLLCEGLSVHQVFIRAGLADFMQHRLDTLPPTELDSWTRQGWFYFPVADRTGQLNSNLIAELRSAAFRADYSRISKATPITFIHGTLDCVVPMESTKTAASKIRHARFEIIEGADHSFSGPSELQLLFDKIVEKWI